jgi:S-disulfanyl-L-cysteine oxidoreductase SoxD
MTGRLPTKLKVLCVANAAAAVIAVLVGARAYSATAPFHFANADNAALVGEGEQVYALSCASCHGRRLQGQALWQLRDQYAGMRAPAHDQTGHTWQHGDEELFHMTKYGRFAAAPINYKSYMPAYEHRLSDRQILAVIAYIKSRWPIGLRAAQSTLNPNFAGMPKHLDKVQWTLPPNCRASFQNWQQSSK